MAEGVSSAGLIVDDERPVYVVVEKAGIHANAGMRTDQKLFYNFAAGMVLERVLHAGPERVRSGAAADPLLGDSRRAPSGA